MSELHWTQVDGVTTVWAESQGPLCCGLLFRAGRCDETLATSGRTHLIEHMALATIPDVERRHEGFVGALATGFATMGRPEEVAAYLGSVCDALVALPSGRLEAEKSVLEAEAATRSPEVIGELLAWRYGAAGYGLIGMPELGIASATLDELQAYSAQRFTRENAVLWLSGPPPAGLRLPLLQGMRLPAPPLAPVLSTLPCWFTTDELGGVAVGTTVPREPAVSLFCEIVNRRLRERLRTERAVSYSPDVGYEPLDAETGHVILYADSGEERRAELVSAFADVLTGLDEVDDAEVETARKVLLDGWTGPLAPPPDVLVLQELERAALDWIAGRAFEPMAAAAAEVAAVTTAEVVAFGELALGNALFALSSDVDPAPCMGVRAPLSHEAPVEGREAASADAPVVADRLVVGRDGVTVRGPDGLHATVRYAQLEAALSFRDGGVCLVGRDGTWLVIEPTLWRDGQRFCREIRECVPVRLLLDQGSRPAEAIPRPETTALQRLLFRLSGS